MATDWFIWFDKKGKSPPSREDLGKALRDYLGDFAKEIYWEHDRYFAILIGTKSSFVAARGVR